MITGIGHCAYSVRDLDASLEFYVKGLGMDDAFRLHGEDGAVWIVYLYAGNGAFVELFPGREGAEDGSTRDGQSYRHLCLAVDDMSLTLDDLSQKGIEPLGPPSVGKDGNTQAWLKDPDGNPIELMQIAPTSEQGRFLAAKAEKRS